MFSFFPFQIDGGIQLQPISLLNYGKSKTFMENHKCIKNAPPQVTAQHSPFRYNIIYHHPGEAREQIAASDSRQKPTFYRSHRVPTESLNARGMGSSDTYPHRWQTIDGLWFMSSLPCPMYGVWFEALTRGKQKKAWRNWMGSSVNKKTVKRYSFLGPQKDMSWVFVCLVM